MEELYKLNKELEKDKKRKSNHYEYSDSLPASAKRALDDLELKHDTSWMMEMFERNKNNLNSIALLYRGNKITYKEMFEEAYKYAKSLKQMGYDENSVVPVCMSNMPEFIYIFLALNMIGSTINVVGSWFNENYLINILNNTNSKTIFISDDEYGNLKGAIEKSNIKKICMFSLTDSFKMGNKYESIDNRFHKIENLVPKCNDIIDRNEFVKIGENYDKDVVYDGILDDVCAITYTSGTTDPGCPKGVVHANRSYITLSRYKESDVSGMPSMRNLTVLGHIPTYTHMELSCAISDTLYEGCTLALEPFYDKDFFPYSLLINEPNFVPASVGFWGNLCKLLNFDPEFKYINLPFLMIPTVTGEACSRGEEKFFNYTSKKHKFGTDKLPFPLSPVTFSIGGGTSESSGIFVTLFKSLQEKKYVLVKKSLGLTPHKFVQIEVLNSEGEYCKLNEPGLLVANSPCNMLRYTDDKLNKKSYVLDANGNRWLSLNTYSYKSDNRRIKMKGRMGAYIESSVGNIPYYLIEDIVDVDSDIMSSCLVKVGDNYVCHIEKQPLVKEEKMNEIIEKCQKRLICALPDDVVSRLYLRVRNNEESFPLAPSGKRNYGALINEGITDKCIKIDNVKKLIKKN